MFIFDLVGPSLHACGWWSWRCSSGGPFLVFMLCAEESIILVNGAFIMTAEFMDIQLLDVRAYDFQWVE